MSSYFSQPFDAEVTSSTYIRGAADRGRVGLSHYLQLLRFGVTRSGDGTSASLPAPAPWFLLRPVLAGLPHAVGKPIDSISVAAVGLRSREGPELAVPREVDPDRTITIVDVHDLDVAAVPVGCLSHEADNGLLPAGFRSDDDAIAARDEGTVSHDSLPC